MTTSGTSWDSAVGNNRVILALDVGSSSVRASLYSVVVVAAPSSSSSAPERGPVPAPTATATADAAPAARAGAAILRSVQQERRSVLSSGRIDTSDLFDVIDQCVDQVLREGLDRPTAPTDSGAGVVVAAVGFSTFCMNLVGLDEHGAVIGHLGAQQPEEEGEKEDDEEETGTSMSYACRSEEVDREVEQLKRCVSD
jgi:hypothetical protein